MTTRIQVVFAVALSIVLGLIPGRAASGIVKIAASECIRIAPVDGAVQPRILVKFDLPRVLSGTEVDYAEVRMTLRVGRTFPPRCLVKAWPINMEWDAQSVSWTNPWSVDGGDLGSQGSSVAVIAARVIRDGVAKVELDATEIVQRWVDHPRDNHGIAILSSDPNLKTSIWEAAESEDNVVLEIFCTANRDRSTE